MRNRSEHSLALYNRFVETLESIGPFIFAPAKTRIGFQVRMIFAAINRMGSDFIDGHLILARRCESKRFYKIELDTVHRFKIRRAEEIDAEFTELMQEAYRVGEQQRLFEK
ncbi:MAG: DUF5655 domain-containing protein [bacterium]